ncbi:class I SAM-dependent methyltransferase [Sphaerospermopsis aphanizomenoides BCCUSP55]|uniref:class I SAM-dependent methyltransferase n=1 Tax=Sphaerospermopsis aphanizomenoides TaxID=459663 RepID=UPI0019074323|nr:class I SAM-dependent methyltransferase [Sphaerospermopsis aphanizomenoides]MBK1989756.1 class I SAM-dependent methyltransferase [Sphaerospermopsis aphanizomenoides BCCUSP55]
MNNSNSDLWDKIREQFDSAPYPNTPLDKSPKNDVSLLYYHNLVTAYYLRNQQVIDTKDKIILDAGCGAGYKSLVLAKAKPGAKIVGVDISAESVKLAKQRLEYHGFDNAEFHVLSICDVKSLGYAFDYINCNETLYLFPDISLALKSMKSVLKPEGIIRANLHSAIQRFNIFCAQKAFTIMGLMEDNPGDLEIDIVTNTMNALKDNVFLKNITWSGDFEKEDRKERILMNYLFQGDKGYTVGDLFSALQTADLEFISMLNWRQWDLVGLFKEPDNLPTFLAMSLPEISIEEQLQLFELLHPRHRLLDFWCGHPQPEQNFTPVFQWDNTDWKSAKVYLHPQFNNAKLNNYVTACISTGKIFPIYKNISLGQETIYIDSSMALCILPLFEKPYLMMDLVEYWRQRRPIDSFTGEPIETTQVFELVKNTLSTLEGFDCVMLEKLSS